MLIVYLSSEKIGENSEGTMKIIPLSRRIIYNTRSQRIENGNPRYPECRTTLQSRLDNDRHDD